MEESESTCMRGWNHSGPCKLNSTEVNITGFQYPNFSTPYDDEIGKMVNFQYYAWGIAGNIISSLGLLGNFLSIFVLSSRRMRSSTSVYLIALSVFDSLVLISLTLFMALPAIYYATGALKSYQRAYPYLQPYAYPIALTAQTCSIYITVGFTIERYIAVVYPLKASQFCTVDRAKKAVGMILLSSMIYNIPRWLEYKTDEQWDPVYNETIVRYVQTDFGMSKTFRHVYHLFMHIFVMLLIPCTVLSVFNTLLIRAVKHSALTQGKVTNKQRRENNLTAMLISVVIVFLICQVTSIVDNIFAAVLDPELVRTLPFVQLSVVSSLMVILNSAINFYLYCVFGQKFREVFCRIFCVCYGRPRGHSSSVFRGATNGVIKEAQTGHAAGSDGATARGAPPAARGIFRFLRAHHDHRKTHGQPQVMKVGKTAYTAVCNSPKAEKRSELHTNITETEI